MPKSPTPSQPPLTFCLGCGYMLQQLTGYRGPECGREFDPADPRTMSISKPLRAWQRRLLRPMGWPTIFLALLGTAGLAYLSDWLHWRVEPWSVLRDEFRSPMQVPKPFTGPDWIFYAAVGLWAGAVALMIIRQIGRLLIPRTARRALHPGATVRRRRGVMGVAVALTVLCMAFGWQQRVGRRWMARVLVKKPAPAFANGNWFYFEDSDAPGGPLFHFSPEQSSLILGNLMVDLPTAPQRRAAIKILVENSGKAALPSLLRSAERENDPELLCTDLHLIGLCRDPSTASFLTANLDDSHPNVRAAALDAIGILRHPSYSILLADAFWLDASNRLDTTPPIFVGGLLSPPNSQWPARQTEHEMLSEPFVAIDPGVREKLQRMMMVGSSTTEREAAARALVIWPPKDYTLRVAEWGVWIENAGHFALAKSILEEIPPFVHRTGNRTDSFGDYFLYPSMVDKPIVHLTGNAPLAVDMEVHIREGRPWFAYPMPDDFGLDTSYFGNRLPLDRVSGLSGWPPDEPEPPNDFTAPPIKPLADCREGYPWLVPHHRRYSSGWQGEAPIFSVGLHWQSLIVSPTQLPWMTPPSVPNDPKFRWWSRLRQVPSCWIANRGEAERFLYYDGPTRASIPMIVRLEGTALRFYAGIPEKPSLATEDRDKHHFEPMAAQSPPRLPPYEGMYIDFHDGVLRGMHMVVVDSGKYLEIPANLPLTGDAVIQRFREMLLSYGLTAEEAEGLIAAWTPQFFQTPGRRFVLRMSPADYARQCPMQVRPTPTTVVRLGLILTEFDSDSATHQAK